MRRALIGTLAAVALLAPAAGAQVTPSAQDVVTSDNVEHIGSFRIAGDGTGARVIGDILYTTSSLGIFIFDIADPESPQLLGGATADIHFENEDVPTNGKILAVSDSTVGQSCNVPADVPAGCLQLWDVTDPAAISKIANVSGISAHTAECVFDCTWFYGSEGQIVDARDPRNAKVLDASWTDAAIEQGYDVTQVSASPHDVTEVAPGYVLTSSQPSVLFSLHPEHGASPESPVVIASGSNQDLRFIHSNKWPRQGRDKFILLAGESVLGPVGNGGGPCNDQIAAFMTWDARPLLNPEGGYNRGTTFTLIDEVRPYNGNYVDGGHPVDAFGCSVHWFDEHPTWKNGGLVAVAEYEHGTRLYEVNCDGKLTEQDYALPIAGATSAPYWARNGKVFYTMDYQRGMDIWRYTGETFVPEGCDDPGAVRPEPPAPPDGGSLGLTVGSARSSVKNLLKKGIALPVECSRACDLKATLSVDSATARKYRLGSRKTIASTTKKSAVKTSLHLRVSSSAARRLRRAKRLTLTLRVTATAADGRSASGRRTLRLK